MEKKNNYEVAARGIRVGGFAARLFGYAVFYVPIGVVLLITAALGGAKDIVRIFGIPNTDLAISIVLFGGLAIPFVLWEMSIRRFRRKHNLSIWKNVSAELEQMVIDERVAKEHKAYVNNGIAKDPSGDKTDIGYWFGLLEKGAITQVEYEAKKKELL